MRQSLKKLAALALVLSLCAGASTASAAVQSSLYLDAYCAWLIAEDYGRIDVAVYVQALDDMDEVGASRIELFESQDDGETWQSIKIHLKSLYPEMVATDTYLYYQVAMSYDGRPGYKYCAIVTIYAGDSTGSDTREYTTPVVTAVKRAI